MRARTRPRGHPNQPIRVRVPDELVEELDREGEGNRSYGLCVMLDRAKDAKDYLGKHYVEVVIMAHQERITEGEALGRLALEGIMRTPAPAPTFGRRAGKFFIDGPTQVSLEDLHRMIREIEEKIREAEQRNRSAHDVQLQVPLDADPQGPRPKQKVRRASEKIDSSQDANQSGE